MPADVSWLAWRISRQGVSETKRKAAIRGSSCLSDLWNVFTKELDLKAEFDRYAGEYDRLLEEALPASHSERYFAEYKVLLLRKRTQGRSIRTVLDFGCGTGRSIPFLLAEFPQARVFGFDPSEECLHRARASFPEAQFASSVEQFSDSFDLVLAANVFHHVPPDQRSGVLRAARSCLRTRVAWVSSSTIPLIR